MNKQTKKRMKAENPQQEQFGDNRLLEILRNTHFDSARQVIDTLKAEVDTHRNGAEPNDDLTMMCLRVNQNVQKSKYKGDPLHA